MMIGGTFQVIALVGKLFTDVEDVGKAPPLPCQSSSFQSFFLYAKAVQKKTTNQRIQLSVELTRFTGGLEMVK